MGAGGDGATDWGAAGSSGGSGGRTARGGGTGAEHSAYDLTVHYSVGTAISPAIVYAIWLETDASSFVQPIYVCSRLMNGSLTGTALPYWSTKRRALATEEQVDAVTGATVKASDFEVTHSLVGPSFTRFTVYVEMDHSFDANDWFDDQPAVLWSARVDLEQAVSDIQLEPMGWTPNEKTVGQVPGTTMGTLEPEMRYITRRNDGSDGFGGEDSRSATNMVGRLWVTVAVR